MMTTVAGSTTASRVACFACHGPLAGRRLTLDRGRAPRDFAKCSWNGRGGEPRPSRLRTCQDTIRAHTSRRDRHSMAGAGAAALVLPRGRCARLGNEGAAGVARSVMLRSAAASAAAGTPTAATSTTGSTAHAGASARANARHGLRRCGGRRPGNRGARLALSQRIRRAAAPAPIAHAHPRWSGPAGHSAARSATAS